jgi:hypothetical protein
MAPPASRETIQVLGAREFHFFGNSQQATVRPDKVDVDG